MAQIGSNLRPSEYEQFNCYADDLQVSNTSLANLLIRRELRRKRLAKLREKHPAFRGLREHRITANQTNPPIKAAFEAHVREIGLGTDAAAGILFRAELRERWLDRTVGPRKGESI